MNGSFYGATFGNSSCPGSPANQRVRSDLEMLYGVEPVCPSCRRALRFQDFLKAFLALGVQLRLFARFALAWRPEFLYRLSGQSSSRAFLAN